MAPHDANPEDISLLVPLPPSPTPDDPRDAPSIYHRPPTPFASDPAGDDLQPHVVGCTCSVRLLVLERDLEETRRAVAQRDEAIVDLRRAITELRLATLGR